MHFLQPYTPHSNDSSPFELLFVPIRYTKFCIFQLWDEFTISKIENIRHTRYPLPLHEQTVHTLKPIFTLRKDAEGFNMKSFPASWSINLGCC